ncbi:unnamed protein product [Phyllotreta striolata]|uniref:Odorant receptor n=1 Tax=Phyllotreta striolata TaxID=444603 RepID=A0A9N9TID3_PHYSR|nr:unnamed protein product [Phyllotreta striolata]
MQITEIEKLAINPHKLSLIILNSSGIERAEKMFFDRLAYRLMKTTDFCKLPLWFTKLLLQSALLWPVQKASATKKLLLFAVIMICCTFIKFGLLVTLTSKSSNIVESAAQIRDITLILQASVKIVFLYYNHKKFQPFINMILNDFWPSNLFDEKSENRLKTFYNAVITMMILNTMFSTAYCITVTVSALLKGEFQMDTIYPFLDYKSSPFYELNVMLQYVSLQYFCHVGIFGADFLFMSICTCVISQYKLLCRALSAFGTDEMMEINEKLRGIGTDQLIGRNYGLHKEYFVRCVNHHRMLLMLTENVNSIFSFMTFLTLTVCTAGVCTGVFTLSSLETITVPMVLIIANYTMGFLTELFVYCIIGNEFYEEALLLPEFIFAGNWNEYANNGMTKDLKFMIHRSQSVSPLHAYGLYNINMDSFAKVLKLSFSVYTFLSTIKNK